MLSFLPRFLLAPLAFLLFCSNLMLCGMLVFFGGLLKLLLPFTSCQRALLSAMHAIFRFWALSNFLIITLCNKVEWQISGDQQLHKQAWYLLIANHTSWLDIMVLTHFARTRIPEPKFFLKDSLKKIPFLGMACWALNMPFMKRYSRAFIAQHPHLKGQDIQATQASCQHFQQVPTTIINFVEGTRFSQAKQQQNLSFKHLLMPKAAGIAFTLAAMQYKFDKLLNITLLYPENTGHVMIDTLTGRLSKVVLHVEQLAVTEQLYGDYANDHAFKHSFQLWLNELWRGKDRLIEQLKTG
jgi:1-acyl-sn-glycerol-3-phosphate acyltransferase